MADFKSVSLADQVFEKIENDIQKVKDRIKIEVFNEEYENGTDGDRAIIDELVDQYFSVLNILYCVLLCRMTEIFNKKKEPQSCFLRLFFTVQRVKAPFSEELRFRG